MIKDTRNKAKIRLRNLIHPIFVKKSQRYLGIPPRIKTNKAINIINFNDIDNIAWPMLESDIIELKYILSLVRFKYTSIICCFNHEYRKIIKLVGIEPYN